MTGTLRIPSDDQPVGTSRNPRFVQRAIAVDKHRESDVRKTGEEDY